MSKQNKVPSPKITPTVQVTVRLDRELVERLQAVVHAESWPPPPSQSEIVARGVDIVLRTLEKPRTRVREAAE